MHLLASATSFKLILCPCTEAASTALCGTSAMPLCCFPEEVWIQQEKGTVQAKSWKVLAQQLPRGCEDQGELRKAAACQAQPQALDGGESNLQGNWPPWVGAKRQGQMWGDHKSPSDPRPQACNANAETGNDSVT